MDEFLTDEQQADRAKRWLGENGLFLAAGVVLGLGVLFGWQAWEDNRAAQAVEAAGVYEQLRSAVDGERFNEVTETLDLLEQDYAATPYVDQGRLAVARMHMGRNAPADALDVLQQVATGGSDAQLRRVAEMRIAQINIYLENYDEALKVLGGTDESAFVGQYHEFRGDIFYARGEYENARDEYELALEKDEYNVIDRGYVQMKLDDVAGSVAAMSAEMPMLEESAAEAVAGDEVVVGE